MAAPEQADVDMGNNDDDESSEEEEIELTEADQQRIMQLEAALEANPTVYDTHIQLLDLLRQVKLKARLRDARQRAHALFPFNETQWMDWINDEMDGISSQEDVERIQHLFQLAVEDYISVTLWESYLEFLQAADPEVSGRTPAGVAKFRQVAELALTAAGLHLSEGHHLWEVYRSYEQAVAAAAAAAGGDKAQDKVRSLYHRQLQLPQPSAEDLLKEYEAWEAEHGKGSVPDHIRAAAQRSAFAAQLRAAHEAALSPDKAPDAELLAAYMAYIQLEKAQKDPARLQLLYERAIAAFPVTSELWLQYTKYLEQELKVATLVNKVYARAVRNCPWVGALWAAALRALERFGGDDEQHAALAEQALAAGLQGPEDYIAVLLARADCLRHQLPSADASSSEAATKLRAWFRRSKELLSQSFPDLVDRSLRLPGYWAHCEGVLLGELPAMRAVWEEAVKGPLGRCYETWLMWINMERGLRQLLAARAVFKRSYSRKFDEGGQLALAYEWLRFEREEGSADDLFQAQLKVQPIIEEATAAATAATNQPAGAQARAAAQAAKKLSREEVKSMRRANDPNWKERKPGVKRDFGDGEAAPTKRNKSREAEAEDSAMADAGTAAAAAAAAAGGGGGPAGGGPVIFTDEHTVFVKGLGFDVDEEDLRKLFEGLGVKAVRLGRDKVTGQRRGFAYVDFEDDDAVRQASEKDGQVVNGRRLFIAKSAPPGARGGRGVVGGRGGRGPFAGRGGRGEGEHGGGRGRGEGGRGREGLGFGGRGRSGGRRMTNTDHAHTRLQLDGQPAEEAAAPAAGSKLLPSAALVPRALLSKHAAGHPAGHSPAGTAPATGDAKQTGAAAVAAADGPPKTNEDFKKMLHK